MDPAATDTTGTGMGRYSRLVEIPEEIDIVPEGIVNRLLDLWDQQDERQRKRALPKGSREEIIERAKAYAAKEPIAISGQNGHGRCFHVACQLVIGFNLNTEEAFQAIQDWNARCQPPWSEKELRHKLKEANKQPGERGLLLKDTGRQKGSQTGEESTPAQEATAAKPSRKVSADNIATIDDLVAAGSQMIWLWPKWIQSGVLTAVAALGGTGKTRFCADLLRRIRHGLPWPDGTPMTCKPDALALWVVSDNHHDEMVSLAKDFDIKDAIKINAYKDDPYGGVSLETPEDLRDLEARIKIVKPTFVVVDTVGNATDLSMSKQEDAKAFYFPLQVMARKYHTSILCLTHLNATGHFLGRRVLEKVRVAIRMEQPDKNEEKRRVEVTKTNSKRPSPLGLFMGDQGNEYDNSPPASSEEFSSHHKSGPAPEKIKKASEWLKESLSHGPKRVSNTRTEAEMEGISVGTLYKVKEVLPVEEYTAEGKKWWRLTTRSEE